MVSNSETKILIVEDEGLIAIDLKRRLEKTGYTVIGIAADSQEAMAAMEADTPNLVLMDIHIRGQQDGIEVAGRIRDQYRTPVIFVSAYANDATLERAKITEPFGYIVKPFSGVNFHAQIEMALWKHRMEKKLRASEAWLAATVRNVADALITTDATGNIVLINEPAAKLTGWAPEEAAGKPLLEVFRVFEEATGEPAIHPLEVIYDGRALDTSSRAMRLFDRAEKPVLVDVEMSWNSDSQGDSLGAIIVFRDITARRQAEYQERQLQKMNSLAMLATGLGSELTLLHRKMDDAVSALLADTHSGHRPTLRTLHKLLSRQQVLSLQLSSLGKTEHSEQASVDLNQTLLSMEDQFRQLAGSAATLTLKLDEKIPHVSVPPAELRSNLLRLVGESRVSVADGGAIEIETKSVQMHDGSTQARIAIHDNGRGVRPNARNHVFDPYYQARPGNRNAGLSLAVVQQFVLRNGGAVEVETQPAIEEGTTFLLTFPGVRANLNEDPPAVPAHAH